MKVLLLAKRNKPYTAEVRKALEKRFDTVRVYEGEVSDPFPKAAENFAPDILISYLSPWIVPEKVLRRTKLWNINFHPGPPEYPGIGCFNFALYDLKKIYGVTAHLMEPKVDTGKIIAVKRFAVVANETVEGLMDKSYRAMFQLFNSILKSMDRQILSLSGETWKRKPYRRFELDALCLITPSMSPSETKKRIRAVTFPGKPGAYLDFHGYRFEYRARGAKS